MTLQEMAVALGLKNAESLRKAVHKGIINAERVGNRTFIITLEEVERYRREHLGKRGFASTEHPHFGTRPTRQDNREDEGISTRRDDPTPRSGNGDGERDK